jgi:hypothetical protein
MALSFALNVVLAAFLFLYTNGEHDHSKHPDVAFIHGE